MMRRVSGRYKGAGAPGWWGRQALGRSGKRQPGVGTTGPQEMEELPWGPEAVCPHQVYLVTPGLGGLFWRQPFTTTRLRSRRLHADTQMAEAAQQSVAFSRPLSGFPNLAGTGNALYPWIGRHRERTAFPTPVPAPCDSRDHKAVSCCGPAFFDGSDKITPTSAGYGSRFLSFGRLPSSVGLP